jgi:hypothetical protein
VNAAVTLALTSWLAASPGVTAIAEGLALFDQHAEVRLAALSAKQLRALDEGKVVRSYTPPVPPGTTAGVFGLIVTDVGRRRLWLAARDSHLSVTEGLVEQRLGSYEATKPETWFGLLRLPPPFASRHWRIHVRTHQELSRATKKRAWLRGWKLAPDGEKANLRDAKATRLRGVTASELEVSVFTPESHGAWIILTLGDGRTLLGYRATTDVGGYIPAELMRTFSLLEMSELLRGAEDQARQVHRHYRGAHAVMHDGDGQPIQRYSEIPAPETPEIR